MKLQLLQSAWELVPARKQGAKRAETFDLEMVFSGILAHLNRSTCLVLHHSPHDNPISCSLGEALSAPPGKLRLDPPAVSHLRETY